MLFKTIFTTPMLDDASETYVSHLREEADVSALPALLFQRRGPAICSSSQQIPKTNQELIKLSLCLYLYQSIVAQFRIVGTHEI